MKKGISVILAVLLAVSCLTGLSGCGSSKKTTLYVYNWGQYISEGDDGSLDVIAAFEEAYPNIRVQYSTYDSNEIMYSKLSNGGITVDVIIPSDYMIGRMRQEGMLQELNYDNIPNAKFIDASYRGMAFDPEDKYSVPYTWGTTGIIYNTKYVDEADVTGWELLWNEKYAGKILMFDNSRDAFGIAEYLLGYDVNTTDEAELQACAAKLAEQKPVVQQYVMDQIFDAMENEEAWIAPYYAGDAVTMIGDNPDLDFVVPKEGTNRFVDAMVVPKSSKNKDLAEQFINFMLEEDVALANIEYIGYSTPMSNVKELLDEEVQNSFSYPDEEVLSRCETFVNLDDETTAYMQDNWTGVLSYGNSSIGDIIFLIVFFLFLIGAVIFFTIKKRRDRAI